MQGIRLEPFLSTMNYILSFFVSYALIVWPNILYTLSTYYS
jgi:hypothetical protein